MDNKSPYYDDYGTDNQKLGRKIYQNALSDRRGFRDDQIGIDSEEDIWLEIFEEMGACAKAALDANTWRPMRFLAYDSFNFIDDLTTPYDSLMKPATLREFKFDKHGRLVAYFTFDNGGTSSQFAENLRPLPTPPQEKE